MNEILLQTIVEKLEALEVAFLKNIDASKVGATIDKLKQEMHQFRNDFTKFSSKQFERDESINRMASNIGSLRLEPNSDRTKHVKHIHHFHNRIWATASIFLISLLSAYGWINCFNEKKAVEANDMKYRYWKVYGNKHLLKISYYTDSLYDLDKKSF